jgi:NADPH-dependent glutamate synthase beta chain and related oxidoreductases
MRKPFAITLGRRVEPGQPHRRLAHRAPGLRAQPAAVQQRLPGGENIQQWLYDAEEGPAKYEAAWRQIMQDNPFPAVMGRVCYRPCETACNRAQLTGRGHQLGGAVPRRTRRSARAGRFPSTRRRRVSGCWW